MARYTVYLGLGSNLGDSLHIFDAAVSALHASPGIATLRESQRRTTAPVGSGYSRPFLNSMLELQCDLAPAELLAVTQTLETKLGRDRSQLDRIIDLDIVLVRDMQQNQWITQSENPILPHPRMHTREFVLTPLYELLAAHPWALPERANRIAIES